MRRLLLLTLLPIVFERSTAADIVHIFPESGAFVVHEGIQCTRGFRDTVLAVVRSKIRVDAEGAVLSDRLADDLVATDFGVWAVWRSGSQTLVVAVRPKRGTDRRDVEVSLIDRSGGQPCYEKWRGLAQ